MESITIGQVITFIIALASFIGAISVICATVSKIYAKQVEKIINPLINPLSEHMKEIDKSQCKNFLVRFLADVEQEKKMDEVEIERAHEVYEHYREIGGNSYIEHKWQKLMEY